MKNEKLEDLYTKLYEAFDFFNKELFDNHLPPCILSFTPLKRAYGYFQNDIWETNDKKKDTIHHISINPEYINNNKDNTIKVLSTLVHEMTHLQQQCFGKPSKNGYHNKEWVQLMLDVGLIASSTGEPGGKQTGTNVTHYWEKGSIYEKAAKKLLKTGFKFAYKKRKLTKTKSKPKTKYTCEERGVSVWGKEGLIIQCGVTGAMFEEQPPQRTN